MDSLEFRHWLDDCVTNAKAKGLDDQSILLALMDELIWVMVTIKIKLYSGKE